MHPPHDTRADPVLSRLRREAEGLGFSGIGVTTAEPLLDAGKRLMDWLQNGYAGTMSYMERNPDRRINPSSVLPEAKSILCLAHPYFPGDFPSSNRVPIKISRYAWGRDYHHVVRRKIEKLEKLLKAELPSIRTKSYVDTGPVLEKALAERSGLGFIGKNTLLITPTAGSWVFLAAILTTHPFPASTGTPALECGTCRQCIDACPTGALVGPFQLDARRCISYLTIENKGPIPGELAALLSGWSFGCDICQEICPYNRGVLPTGESKFSSSAGAGPYFNLSDLPPLSDETGFRSRYNGTPLMRAKFAGMRRNVAACVQETASDHSIDPS